MIQINSLSKIYGNRHALQDVNINLFPGELVGIIGPNGAGKTTLLRLISALIKPSQGEIYIDEQNIFDNPIDIKKYLGIVETEPNLYPKLTLEDHLIFIKEIYSIDIKVFQERKERLYALLNFKDEPCSRIEELSHGNIVKSSFACALIHNPQILILDEPLNGVDPISSKVIKDYLRYLTKEEKKLILISSHIIESLAKICDRLIILNNGSVIDDLDAKKMRENKIDIEDYFVSKIKENRETV